MGACAGGDPNNLPRVERFVDLLAAVYSSAGVDHGLGGVTLGARREWYPTAGAGIGMSRYAELHEAAQGGRGGHRPPVVLGFYT